MAKTIKRVGIIFFVLVVSLLVAVGSVFTVDLTSMDFNANANDITAGGTLDNSADLNSNAQLEVPSIPQSDNEYTLSCSCPNGTPCTCGGMAEIWNNAVAESLNKSIVVKVTLGRDWIAKTDSTYVTSFGADDTGFSNGRICTVDGANIILDLNGHIIDRNLDDQNINSNGAVIYSGGAFTLMDSNYSLQGAKNIYDQCKSENNNFANFKQKLIDAGYGMITGGTSNADQFGSGIRSLNSLNIYSGIIMGNYAAGGGGIFHANSIFNFYGGMIVNNYATQNGGGIFTYNATTNLYNCAILNNSSESRGGGAYIDSAKLNMYSGEISDNFTNLFGAGVNCYYNSEFNLYNGKISYNRMSLLTQTNSSKYGIGVYIDGSKFYMYSGEITYNYDGRCGGGLAIDRNSYGVIYDGLIAYNKSIVNSTGVLVYRNSNLEMFGGEISHNELDRTDTVDRIDAGAGMGVQSNSKFYMYGGAINYNKIINCPDDVGGAGIESRSNCMLVLNNGEITGNTIETEGKAFGGGIYCEEKYGLQMDVGIKIYGNSVKDKTSNNFRDSDLYLIKDQKIYMVASNGSTQNYSKVGICLSDDYVGETTDDNHYEFTSGLQNIYDASTKPNNHYFSNKDNEIIETVVINGRKELKMVAGTKTTKSVTWSWEGAENGSTQKITASVTFSGEPYVLSLQGEEFYAVSNATPKTEFSLTEVGRYAFYTVNDYVNPTFVFNILPKEVDILWKNTNLVYNGGMQKPIAYIAEDANCNVTVLGEECQAGSYIASATGLSNKNYKINSSTMNSYFNIAKAKVEKPFGSGAFEFGKSETFIPTGFDSNLMNITGNTQSAVGRYEATISLKDKLNYEWADGGNEDIKLQYAITLAPVVEEDNSVYKFIYLDTEDNTRKTYTEGDLKHGLNDSNVNIKDEKAHYVLGNILPETSVKDFVQTLNYDTAKLKVFNNKGVEVALTDEVTVVGSGWYIEYTPVAGGAKDTIYLSVLGDVTGDGRIDATDITYLRRIANGEIDKEALNPAILLAAMVDNRGKITSVDAEILRAICKYETVINKYF